jgi:hypothetical protein
MVVTWAGSCITLLRDVIHIPANPLSLQTLWVHIIASESGGHSLHGQGTRELTSHGVREGRQRVLAGFQAAQDKKILDLGLESAQSAWRAADWEVQSLDETMTRLQYYQGLVNGGLNSGATGHQLEPQTAMQSQNATVAIWPKVRLRQPISYRI